MAIEAFGTSWENVFIVSKGHGSEVSTAKTSYSSLFLSVALKRQGTTGTVTLIPMVSVGPAATVQGVGNLLKSNANNKILDSIQNIQRLDSTNLIFLFFDIYLKYSILLFIIVNSDDMAFLKIK